MTLPVVCPEEHTGHKEILRESPAERSESVLRKIIKSYIMSVMFKDAFIKLDSAQAAKLAEVVNPHLDIKFDAARVTAMTHNLSFYQGWYVAELSDHDQSPPVLRIVVCNDKGDVVPLNWSNAPIYKLNKLAPLVLNDNTLLDYVRFFFTFVRGKHGRFLIVDNVDDIDWREEPAPAGRKALSKMIAPLTLKSRDIDGTSTFTSSIIFKDSLFASEIVVKPDGHIEMKNEELLVEDIPVADDVFGM